MQKCDVLIVGGGPAGSSCAWKLHAAGVDVLVVDKADFPRDKICAGWVTPPVLDVLDFDREAYAASRVFQPITGFRTGVLGGKEVVTRYDEPVSFGIRRCEFDHYLLEQSRARVRAGTSVRSMERRGNCWRINAGTDDEIETSLLIGAGGHFCPVARHLGGRSNPQASVVAAQEVEFEIPTGQTSRVAVDPAVPELYFCDDLKGYGWCFRKGNFLNIGLGRVDRAQLSSHVEAFCEYLKSRGRVGCDVPPRFHGHAYQLYERVQPKLVDDGVLLIGDAAGLAYPQSGEGIRPAVESGLIAAEVIANSRGEFTRENLESYAERLTSRLGSPRKKSAADVLPAGMLRFLASRLMATKTFSRRIILDRWFLHTNEPALPQSL